MPTPDFTEPRPKPITRRPPSRNPDVLHVDLRIDTSKFTEAMREAARHMETLRRATQRFTRAWEGVHWTILNAQRRHQARHHRIEDPASSRIHAAYDRRRRARRRRAR